MKKQFTLRVVIFHSYAFGKIIKIFVNEKEVSRLQAIAILSECKEVTCVYETNEDNKQVERYNCIRAFYYDNRDGFASVVFDYEPYTKAAEIVFFIQAVARAIRNKFEDLQPQKIDEFSTTITID